jgi:hypothetical protein
MTVFETEAEDPQADLLLTLVASFSESDIPLTEDLTPSLALKHVRHILMIIPNFADALVKLQEFHNQSGQPFALDYRYRAMVAEMGTVRASSQIIKDTELPLDLARSREMLLLALIQCDNAAFYLASGLEDTPDDFETGLDFLRRCRDGMAEPEEALKAFAETQGGSPGGAAAVIEPTEIIVACPEGCIRLQPGCIIKGEVTEEDYKIYYLPGDPRYGEIEIDPANGERWFCTTDEALINTWLPGVG